MQKIYYNENGWVCERYPYDIPKSENYIEVDDEEAGKTYICEIGKSWRVIDGNLSMEIYNEDEYTLNQYQGEYEALKQQLAGMDYKSSKYVDGEYTDEEWQVIVAERKAIREKIRELEKLI